MSDHMKSTHLNRYAGLSIATPSEARRDASRPKEKVESPIVRRVTAPPMRAPVVRDVRDVMREANKQTNKEQNQSMAVRYHPFSPRGGGGRQEHNQGGGGRISPPPSSSLPPNTLDEPQIKCSTCGALIKRAQFATHKAAHVQEEEDGEKQTNYADMEEEMDTESLMVEDKVREEVKSMETHELMDNLINFLDEF